MQIQIRRPDASDNGVAAISYGDGVFVNSNICGNKHITTNIRDPRNEIYSSDSEGGLTIVMQDPKKGGVPSPDTPMCCPKCGAPSTLGKLGSGCGSCNAKFIMDELYPKVMHFFIEEKARISLTLIRSKNISWAVPCSFCYAAFRHCCTTPSPEYRTGHNSCSPAHTISSEVSLPAQCSVRAHGSLHILSARSF